MIGLARAHVIAALGASCNPRDLALEAADRCRARPHASMHWPLRSFASEIEHDRGPVLVTIEYRIDPKFASPSWRRLKARP